MSARRDVLPQEGARVREARRRALLLAGVGVGVAILGLAVSGALLLSRKETRLEPQRVLVEIRAPGASAEEVERSVTVPVERSLTGVPGLVEMESVSGQGISLVRLDITRETFLPELQQAVTARLSGVERTLPSDAAIPVISALPRLDSRLHYTVEAKTEDVMTLRSLNDWDIRQALERLPGVARAASCGGLVKQLEIVPDPVRLNALGVSFASISDAIGAVPSEGLAMHGELTGVEQAASLQLAVKDGAPVLIRDVAQVRVGHAARTCTALRDGRDDVVEGIIDLQGGVEPSRAIPLIAEKLAEIAANALPKGVEIRPLDFSLGPERPSKGRAPSLRLRLSAPPEIALPTIAETVRRTAEVTGVLIQKGEMFGEEMWSAPGDLDVFVVLEPSGRRPLRAVAAEIAGGLATLPGVRYDLSTPSGELPAELRAVVLRIAGEDLDALRGVGTQAVSALVEVRGASAVGVVRDEGEPRLDVLLERQRIAELGVAARDVLLAIEAATTGHVAGSYREGSKRYDVVVRYPPSGAGGAEELTRLPIRAKDGSLVPLSQVARIEAGAAPAVNRIRRRGGARFIEVAFDVRGRDLGDFLEEARRHVAERVKLPGGVSISWGDSAP